MGGLGRRDWGGPFDAVFCVGNSLTHAAGAPGRRAALAAMAGVLRDGGLLVLTSRNWELLRSARPGLEVADRLVERRGRRGLPIRSWSWADSWDEPHGLDVAVALLGDAGDVATAHERLVFWPFEHGTLERELGGAGFERVESTWAPDAERYMVTACRAAGGGAGAARPRPAA